MGLLCLRAGVVRSESLSWLKFASASSKECARGLSKDHEPRLLWPEPLFFRPRSALAGETLGERGGEATGEGCERGIFLRSTRSWSAGAISHVGDFWILAGFSVAAPVVLWESLLVAQVSPDGQMSVAA